MMVILIFVKFISLFSDDDDDDDGAMMFFDYVHCPLLFDDYDVDHAAHYDDGDQVGDEVDDAYDCVTQFFR